MKLQVAKLLYRQGALASLLVVWEPSEDGWFVLLLSARGEYHRLQSFRGAARVLRSLDSAAKIAGEIGFTTFSVRLSPLTTPLL